MNRRAGHWMGMSALFVLFVFSFGITGSYGMAQYKEGVPEERTDGELEKAIEKRLQMDNRLKEDKIGVEVDQGQATLFGTVPTMEQRSLATEVAGSVFGLQSVSNKIRVTPTVTKRQDILNKVKQQLQNIGLLHGTQVTPRLGDNENGHLILEGTVGSHQDRRKAERVTESVDGVTEVDNLLKVVGKEREDGKIAEDVVVYLISSPLASKKDIQVEVEDGVVTLQGSVEHLAYRYALLEDVEQIRGVKRVDVSKIVPKPLRAIPPENQRAQEETG